MTGLPDVGSLVAALPEKYQPIFGHPELSDGSSRACEDRFVLIREAARRMQVILERPLRVLDLGCAQGFFSLSLASDGHQVHGVDFLDLNVNVCVAVAAEHPEFKATFEHGTVEEVIERLVPGEYDLVLGLSVFHHLVHMHGVARVVELCRKLCDATGAGIYELALREEPLYWGPSLPERPAELLGGYPFLRVLSRQATHLSAVARPLYFASSQFWYVAEEMGEFVTWSDDPHERGRGTHQHSRRYFFSEQVFVKKMTLLVEGRVEINQTEFQNEVAFLRDPPSGFPAPRLIAAMDDAPDMFLAREMVEGQLLSDLIDREQPYDGDKVVAEILDQLVVLERAGLYHNDVRCWNVLMTRQGLATLIDYGAVSRESKDCSWLEDLILSFVVTIQEILGRRIFNSNPGRAPVIDFTSLPARYQNAFIRFFEQGAASWTFEELRECISQAADVTPVSPEWLPLYQRLQIALTSYDRRLGALFQLAEHERVELQARAQALEEAQNAQKKVEEVCAALTAELDAAKSRVVALEEVEGWAGELQARIVSSEVDLKQMEARVLGAEVDLKQMEVRVLSSEVDLKHMEARALSSEVAFKQMEERALSAETAGQHAEARALRFEAGVQQAEARALRFETEGQQQSARIIELETDKKSLLLLVDELTESKARVRELLQRAEEIESNRAVQIGASQTHVRDLEGAIAALKHELVVVQAQLDRIENSRTWRFTAPVRRLAARMPGRALIGKVVRRIRAKLARPAVLQGDLASPADAALEKQMVAVDQIASRIRKAKK